MITIEAPAQPINGQTLDAELRAVAGAAYLNHSQGSKWPGVVRLHFADGTPQTAIDAALQVYAAHNPDVLTPEQAVTARRAVAAGELSNADFLAVLHAINDATTLAAAKPILRQLLRLVYRMALAQGLTAAEDPEG